MRIPVVYSADLFSNYSVPSRLMAARLGIPGTQRVPRARQMAGGYLGDASINPVTGGDTGNSDPLTGGSFNWASLLTSVAQTATAVTGALHPPAAPRPVASSSSSSTTMLIAGLAVLGVAGYLAFGSRRR